MPITEVLRFYCPGAVIFEKGAVTEKGGAVTFRGGAVTFQNMRSVQMQHREYFILNLL